MRFSWSAKNSSLACDDAAAERARGEVGEHACSSGRRRPSGLMPLLGQQPARRRPSSADTRRRAGRSRRTTPGSVRPAYGVIWLRCCSSAGVDDERRVGREHEKSASRPVASAPLPVKPGERGRAPRHPAGDVGQREAALARLGPHRRQAELERRDAAPRRAEVAGVQPLQLRRCTASGRTRRSRSAPSRSALPQRLAVASSRIGGQHLNCVAPSGIVPRRRSTGSAGRSRP